MNPINTPWIARQTHTQRRHGAHVIRFVLLVLALALVAWPIWNGLAVPLLLLPKLSYWQMAAVIALAGTVSVLFDRAAGLRHRRRPHRCVLSRQA